MPQKGKSDKEERMEKGDDKCGSCLKAVSDQEGVQCEICDKWYHCRCQSIAEPMYSALNQFSTELHWFCKGCRGGAEKLLAAMSRMHEKMDKIEEELGRVKRDLKSEITQAVSGIKDGIEGLSNRLQKCEKMTDATQLEIQDHLGAKLADIEVKISNQVQPSWSDIASKVRPTWNEIVTQEMETRLTGVAAEMTTLKQQTQTMMEDKEEQEEISKRRNCVIVHGLEEPKGVTAETRKKEDEDRILEILHELECDSVSVNTVIRLGKLSEDPVAKPRPIKLVLASEGQKERILKVAKNLRSKVQKKLDKVFIHQDLTPRQRQKRQELVQERKDRESRGETNLIIVNGKILKKRVALATQGESSAS